MVDRGRSPGSGSLPRFPSILGTRAPRQTAEDNGQRLATRRCAGAGAGRDAVSGRGGCRGAARTVGSRLPDPDHPAAGLRPAARRGDAADRPAGDHGPADRRHPAGTERAWRNGAGAAGDIVSKRQGPGRNDRRGVAARHPDAAVADRHGDRPVSGSPRRQNRRQRVPRRHRGAVRLRCGARRNAAGQHAAQPRAAVCDDPVSRHRAGDLVGQDRRPDDPRARLHAPHWGR